MTWDQQCEKKVNDFVDFLNDDAFDRQIERVIGNEWFRHVFEEEEFLDYEFFDDLEDLTRLGVNWIYYEERPNCVTIHFLNGLEWAQKLRRERA